jgi:hypothetical protein
MERWDSEPLWMFLEEPATVVRPEPEPVVAEPSLWDIEKSRNRLARATERLESGRWLPKLGYKLNRGMVKRVQRELGESHELLTEAADVLAEVKHG